eukprot:4474832-Pyramimonas_sp.AAC.1
MEKKTADQSKKTFNPNEIEDFTDRTAYPNEGEERVREVRTAHSNAVTPKTTTGLLVNELE